MLSVSKPASLVQQKKQQWAREREEMSQLFLPWATGERYTNRLQVRNQFASSLELHKESSYNYQEPVQRQRSPSLPPIHHIEINKPNKDERRAKEVLNRNISSAKRFAFYDEEAEGDTSGYGSETLNHMNIRNHFVTNDPVVAWQQNEKENRKDNNLSRRTLATERMWSARSPGTAEEGRPRWGDRGVATGKLWEPTTANARLPQMQNQKKGKPSWVERGLNMIDNASEVLAIDQRSSTNSGFIECDRSSSNGSDEGKTFLRGQNVPIEPEVRAQRENKRIKALELQSAILNQLEDREKRRNEERERELREERLEELRIQKQQEEDRLKIEEETRKLEEKKIMEQRKLDALKKALEEAEKNARKDKEKKYISYRQVDPPIVSKCENETSRLCDNTLIEAIKEHEITSPNKTSRTYDVDSPKVRKKDGNSRHSTTFNSPRSLGASNVNLFIHNVPPIALTDNKFNIVPLGINGNGEIVSTQPNSLQLAVLVPQNISNNLYSASINSLINNNDVPDSSKIVTPQKYRTLRTKDAFTQTEIDLLIFKVDKNVETIDIERYIDKNYSNIDENAPQDGNRNNFKRDRRLRSEERYKKDIENRPKWGANKPIAQYKKQSEKDPFYSQKRKVRQKYRPARQYMSQSSDDSRSPSPPTRSEKITETSFKQRNSLSQSYWKTKRSNQDYVKNNNAIENFNTDVPEFCSLDQITGAKSEQNKFPKRITLSQKFINDKYGSRKLWTDDISEKSTKYNNFDGENSKKNNDKCSFIKTDNL